MIFKKKTQADLQLYTTIYKLFLYSVQWVFHKRYYRISSSRAWKLLFIFYFAFKNALAGKIFGQMYVVEIHK
jgi:hypothetical protein